MASPLVCVPGSQGYLVFNRPRLVSTVSTRLECSRTVLMVDCDACNPRLVKVSKRLCSLGTFGNASATISTSTVVTLGMVAVAGAAAFGIGVVRLPLASAFALVAVLVVLVVLDLDVVAMMWPPLLVIDNPVIHRKYQSLGSK